MKCWTVESYQEIEGAANAPRAGFIAKIARNGRTVVTVTNLGHPMSQVDGDNASVIMLHDMTRSWLRDAGPDDLELDRRGAVALWVDYEANHRPHGVAARDHLARLVEEAAEAQPGRPGF